VVAILTGRSPVVTGARNNLTPRDVVAANPTIADVLRRRRLSNHLLTTRFDSQHRRVLWFRRGDHSPIGASDFIIGTYNELPLPSVVHEHEAGQYCFPYSYANLRAATRLRSEDVPCAAGRELSFDEPTMLVVHLTAAHWPYYVADTPFGVAAQKRDPNDRPIDRVGLRTADSMFETGPSPSCDARAPWRMLSSSSCRIHGEAMLLRTTPS